MMVITSKPDKLLSMHAFEVLSSALRFLPARTSFAPNFENSMLAAAPIPELEPSRMNGR